MTRYLQAMVATLALVAASAYADGVKAVYHFNLGVAQAAAGLRNISNHLNADPTAKIVVVGHGKGIDFLLPGAKTPNGGEFAGSIAGLAARGVEFFACNNTLKARNIDPASLPLEAKIVPSGVAEIANLQAKQGYVYVKP
ncbi:MAG: DsrE family protein [Burkholderiaceae bacterium]|jgi:hypothetical protein|nr:hypothetical protein [Candidatus Fonsibacter lacus]